MIRIDELNGVEAYKHQWEAYERYKDEEEVPLFFEMGCGKSFTTLLIAGYKFNQQKIDRVLIIAPNDVHKQWAVEQCKWLDKMGVKYVVQCVGGRGGQKQMWEFHNDNALHIICVNIDTFSQPTKWKPLAQWADVPTAMIVIDEATSIKNYDSQRTQHILYAFNNVQKYRNRIMLNTKVAPYRVVLTGTPVTNGPMDLWCIMEFVRPNFFNRDRYSFKFHYGMFTQLGVQQNGSVRTVQVPLTEKTWRGIKGCINYNEAYAMFGCSQDTFMTVHSQEHYEGPYKHCDELKEKLSTVATFCKLADCVDMPKQTYITHTLTMSPDIAGCYKAMLREQAAVWDNHLSTALNKLSAATRLQQISSGFIYGQKMVMTKEELEEQDVMPDEVTWIGNTSPKLEAVKRDVDESDKPLIILTRYTAEAARLYDEFKEKYSTMLYTGWKKTGSIEDFKQGKYDILIANIACVARGFNLQNSHTILFYSNTFSMELRQQAEFRTYRLGQTEVCKYVDYVYEGTVDEDIVKALQMKKNMLEYFREQEK